MQNATQAKAKRFPQVPVYVLNLDTTFPSARKAALAILAATTGEEMRLGSLCGRVSRAAKTGGGSVFGFTVTPIRQKDVRADDVDGGEEGDDE